jgi:hypothetical protein
MRFLAEMAVHSYKSYDVVCEEVLDFAKNDLLEETV